MSASSAQGKDGPRRGRPPTQKAEPADGARSVIRAARILFALAEGPSGVGHKASRVAARLELQPSTTHRILKALASEGLTEQDDATGRWRLGTGTFELGLASAPRDKLVAAAEASMIRISSELGVTTHLVVRSGNDGVCLERREGSTVRKKVVDVGERRPLGIGVSGVALLALLGDLRTISATNATRWQAFGVDAEDVARLVAHAQRYGFATTDEDFYPGVAGVAVAVRLSKRSVASLSVVNEPGTFTKAEVDQIAALLREEAVLFREKLKLPNTP